MQVAGETKSFSRTRSCCMLLTFRSCKRDFCDQELSMTITKIDRGTMGRLAKALAFICGPDHPTTMALKAAAVSGSDREIRKARALFLELSSGDRQAALNLLNEYAPPIARER